MHIPLKGHSVACSLLAEILHSQIQEPAEHRIQRQAVKLQSPPPIHTPCTTLYLCLLGFLCNSPSGEIKLNYRAEAGKSLSHAQPCLSLQEARRRTFHTHALMCICPPKDAAYAPPTDAHTDTHSLNSSQKWWLMDPCCCPTFHVHN